MSREEVAWLISQNEQGNWFVPRPCGNGAASQLPCHRLLSNLAIVLGALILVGANTSDRKKQSIGHYRGQSRLTVADIFRRLRSRSISYTGDDAASGTLLN